MNKNLPMPQKNKFMAKLKKMIFIALSSIGLAGNITAPVQASQTNKTQEFNSKENNFIDSLKVKSESEQIADRLVELRQEKGLGQYSQITGQAEKVRKKLVKLFDAVNENFDMNAKRKGIQAISKEEYKNNLIYTIENLDDIIFIDDLDANNQYTEYFRNDSDVEAYYMDTNEIVIKKGHASAYVLVHEIQHSIQYAGEKDVGYSWEFYKKDLDDNLNKNEKNNFKLEKIREDDIFAYSSYFRVLFKERT